MLTAPSAATSSQTGRRRARLAPDVAAQPHSLEPPVEFEPEARVRPVGDERRAREIAERDRTFPPRQRMSGRDDAGRFRAADRRLLEAVETERLVGGAEIMLAEHRRIRRLEGRHDLDRDGGLRMAGGERRYELLRDGRQDGGRQRDAHAPFASLTQRTRDALEMR